MTSQLIILEVRGLWPIVITVVALIFSHLIVYLIARITSARNFSKKNMAQKAKEIIDDLKFKLAISNAEQNRLGAENNLFRARVETIAIEATRPLDTDQEIQEIKLKDKRNG